MENNVSYWISYALAMILAVVFMSLYSKERTKSFKEVLKNLDLEMQVSVLKQVNTINKDAESSSIRIKFAAAMKQMVDCSIDLMRAFRSSSDFMINFSQEVISSNGKIDNNARVAFMIDCITTRGMLADFMIEMFNVTVDHPDLTPVENKGDREKSKDFLMAKESIECMKNVVKLSAKYAERFIGYLKAAEDRELMISDARFAVMVVEFSEFLAKEVEFLADGKDDKRSKDLFCTVNKMKKLTDIIDNHLSKTHEDANDFDFQSFPDDDENGNTAKKFAVKSTDDLFAMLKSLDPNKKTDGVEKAVNEQGGRIASMDQTKEGTKDFGSLLKTMEQAKAVSKYVKKEDTAVHFEYLKGTKASRDAFRANETEENYEDFRKKAVDMIPVIKTISEYTLWYKLFYETRKKNRKENASMDHPSRTMQVMYMADVKLETLMQDFENTCSDESKKAIASIKSIIGDVNEL